MHVLPDRFHRIRSYGLLANRCRASDLAQCRALLGVVGPAAAEGTEGESWEERLRRLTGIDPSRCRVCGEGLLVLIEPLPPQSFTGEPRSRDLPS